PSGEDKERSPLNRSGDAQLLLRLSSPLTRIAGHLENEIGGGSNGHPKQESAKDERIRVVTTDDVSSLKDADNRTPPQRLLVKMAFELQRDVLSEPVFKPLELHSASFSKCSAQAQ